MAKRSREDFEPSAPDSENTGDSAVPARAITRPAAVAQPASTSSKLIYLDAEGGEAQPVWEMICSLPPHRQTLSFASYEEYEIHYLKTHTNRCTECRKNFPTEHFLNLHIEENHDSLVSVRRERGEKTVCLNSPTLWQSIKPLLTFIPVDSTPALLKTVIEDAQLHRRDAYT